MNARAQMAAMELGVPMVCAPRYVQPARAAARVWLALAALLFAASVAATIAVCRDMAAMDDMPMPGGWTLSMMWMRMPGQTWPGVAFAWLGMWQAMTVAMMLPSLLPMLRRYRGALVASGAARAERATALAALGYFAVWTLAGALVFVCSAVLAALALELPWLARLAPAAGAAAVLIGGLLQVSAWKARRLACCRGMDAACAEHDAGARAAWRHGLRLGWDCVQCCAGLSAIQLTLGMMDLRVMALAAAAICVERLAPGGMQAARGIGVAGAAAGVILLARALGVV